MNSVHWRAIAQGVASILVGLGLIPQEGEEFIRNNADAIISSVLALWTYFTVERIISKNG